MALDDIQITYVDSWEDACRFKDWLSQRREFLAVDVETTGLNVGRDRIRLCQFGDATQGFAFQYRNWRGLIKETLESYQGPMVAHNLLYEYKMLGKDGIRLPQRWMHDSMVMTWLKQPNAKMGLKPAAAKWVDRRAMAGANALSELFSATGWTWETVPVDHPTYWIYGVLDTCLSSMLAEKLAPEILVEDRYREAYELELACIHCLHKAEMVGLKTDLDYRRRASALLSQEVEELRAKIPLEKPSSDTQVRNYLLSLGAQLFVKTEHGALSVDKEVLGWLAERGFPIAATLAEFRSKSRLLTNYFEKIEALAVDDVVYANTRPIEARTGRMSVTDPPLQTLPRGRVVRDAFVARDGHCFVMADFAGMELRALASDAREENMLAAFNRGEDLHAFVAQSLYGGEFSKTQRSICKNGNFSKVYGAGVEKFAVTAGISVEEATSFLAKYDEMFPGVGSFMDSVQRRVQERAGSRHKGLGYIALIDGRRLPVEADKAYKGVNYRIQGSCAIVLKQKIVELDNAGMGDYFRLPVHDELIYEVPLEYREEATRLMEEVMPDRHNFPGVTLEVEADAVDRWGQHYRGEPDFPKYVETEDPEWLDNER